MFSLLTSLLSDNNEHVTEKLALTSTVTTPLQATVLLAAPLIQAISMEEIEGLPGLGRSSLAAKMVPVGLGLRGGCFVGPRRTLRRGPCAIALWHSRTLQCECTTLILPPEG